MALAVLFLGDDDLADRWSQLTKENSKKFFGESQPRVKEVLKKYEIAKNHLQHGGGLDCRLALILLDNVAELLTQRALADRFGFDDAM